MSKLNILLKSILHNVERCIKVQRRAKRSPPPSFPHVYPLMVPGGRGQEISFVLTHVNLDYLSSHHAITPITYYCSLSPKSHGISKCVLGSLKHMTEKDFLVYDKRVFNLHRVLTKYKIKSNFCLPNSTLNV